MNIQRTIGIFAIVIAVPTGIAAWNYGIGTPRSPGAGFWPLLVVVLMSALALRQIILPEGEHTASQGVPEPESRWFRLGVAFVTIVAYIVMLEPVGYVLTTTLFLLAQLRVVESRSWRLSLITSVTAAVLSFVIFRILLKVPLPEGILSLAFLK